MSKLVPSAGVALKTAVVVLVVLAVVKMLPATLPGVKYVK